MEKNLFCISFIIFQNGVSLKSNDQAFAVIHSRRPLRELKIWRKKLDWQNFDQVSVELCRFLYCQRHCSPDGQVSHPLLLSSCEKFIDICSTKSYICKAPVRLRLLASVVQSKKNWQRFYVDDIFVFIQAVSCCHHPGAANLYKMLHI